MRLLIDTHIVLWRLTDDRRLSAAATALMDAASNSVAVSVISIWEVAIKHSLGRKGPDRMPMSGSEFYQELVRAEAAILPVSAEHAATVDRLPWHHRDPFDRLLIAQAVAEPMRLLTHDALLAAYGDNVLVC